MQKPALKQIYEELDKKEKKRLKIKYFVPNLWAPIGENVNFGRPEKISVNPYAYYKEHIGKILHFKKIERKKEEPIIYNSFLRSTAAFDHDGDGRIGGVPRGGNKKDITLNNDGIRESGTFLKAIAQLGHIKRLGCNCVYLLPITKIGKFGNKGNAGSPYAIKNPYEIDLSLADTLIDADINTQFKAFVEACHLVGIKVVLEFAFRTASRDSDWATEHPDWFYWISAEVKDRKNNLDAKGFGSPVFTKEVLKKIKKQVAKRDFLNLPEPPENYKNFYYLPPSSDSIKQDKSGKLTGVSMAPSHPRALAPSSNVEFFEATSKNSSINEIRDTRYERRTKVMLPGAFADWPPDDVQPPWSDVTYLRMYKYKGKCDEYNYMAYNTIRMYEKKLSRDKYANKSLWKKIERIIPYYQKEFNIDGVLIDMGHAMPQKLMKNIISIAKKNKKDFLFLSENFHISEESAQQGYHAVMGYAWSTEHNRDKIIPFLKEAGTKKIPVKFLATGENHDTPRSAARRGGDKICKNSFLINAFIPNGVLFIHSGFELAEKEPLNTGLDFTSAEIKKYKNKPLGLFDITGYHWLNKNSIFKFIQDIMYLRDDYRDIISANPSKSYKILKTNNKNIVGFSRYGKKDGKKTALLVLINYSAKKAKFKIDVCKGGSCARPKQGKICDYLSGKEHKIKGKYFEGALNAYEGKVYVGKA